MQNNEFKSIQENINKMSNHYIENVIKFNRIRMNVFERAIKTQLHIFNDLFAITTNAFESFSKAKKIEDIATINELFIKESTNGNSKITKEVFDNIMQTSTDIGKCLESNIPIPAAKMTAKTKR